MVGRRRLSTWERTRRETGLWRATAPLVLPQAKLVSVWCGLRTPSIHTFSNDSTTRRTTTITTRHLPPIPSLPETKLCVRERESAVAMEMPSVLQGGKRTSFLTRSGHCEATNMAKTHPPTRHAYEVRRRSTRLLRRPTRVQLM